MREYIFEKISKQIGDISNEYGSLYVREDNGTYYWTIESCFGLDDSDWEEIPESLYKALLRFEKKRIKIINND